MRTAGKHLADAVGDAFGIDSGLIFEAEIDPDEARILRGGRDTNGRVLLMRDRDGDVVPAKFLEVFDMRQEVRR